MILHWHVHSKDTYQFCAVQNWHHQHLLNAGFTQKDSAALGAFTGEFVSYVCVNIEKALLIYLLLQHGSFERNAYLLNQLTMLLIAMRQICRVWQSLTVMP